MEQVMKQIIIGLALTALAIGSVKAESADAIFRRLDLERALRHIQEAVEQEDSDAQWAAFQAEQAAQEQQDTLDEIKAKLDEQSE
jgi:hypothetical protein